MESVCTSIPLKPGMWDYIYEHQQEIVNGLGGNDEADYAKNQRGFRHVKVYHQTDPIDALVLYFEAENLEEAFHPKHADHAALEQRRLFWQKVAGLSGPFMAKLPQLMVDWHHEEGHRHRAAPKHPKA